MCRQFQQEACVHHVQQVVVLCSSLLCLFLYYTLNICKSGINTYCIGFICNKKHNSTCILPSRIESAMMAFRLTCMQSDKVSGLTISSLFSRTLQMVVNILTFSVVNLTTKFEEVPWIPAQTSLGGF